MKACLARRGQTQVASGRLARRIAGTGAAAAAVLLAVAAWPVAAQPDAETDPAALGWMRGSPPPIERQVRFQDLGHLTFPKTRWSFSHFRELAPTANIWRGDGPASRLRYALREDLDEVVFEPLGGGEAMTWAQSLALNHADAALIMHRGRIVYERYFGVTTAQTPHMSFSMTKSYCGVLAAMLIAEGRLDETASVASYIPELAGSGFGDATVRQLLDMTTSLRHSEDYSEPRSDVYQFAVAGGLFPRPANYQGPGTFYDYLRSVPAWGAHGRGFAYRSVNTEVLGWLIARVTGQSLNAVLSERLWRPLGAEMDAYVLVDQSGTAWASGGLNATLRDHARFGEMMRLNGRYNGRQIVPASVVEDIRRGGSREQFAQAGYATLPGWSYRNQWWVSHNDHGAFAARGVYGQTIYIDPAAQVVIVRLASHHTAANAEMDPTSLPAYQAIIDRLSRR
jgi:CubicO group peptidase (beta-lactamase class C family)